MNQERTESDFYESRVVIKQQPDGLWIGRTRFIRKDTNEEVGRGKTLTATTREQLEECLKNATEVAMRAMPRQRIGNRKRGWYLSDIYYFEIT